MSKNGKKRGAGKQSAGISKKDYRNTLRTLQIELVKLQRHFIQCDDKILVLIEGRPAPGLVDSDLSESSFSFELHRA